MILLNEEAGVNNESLASSGETEDLVCEDIVIDAGVVSRI